MTPALTVSQVIPRVVIQADLAPITVLVGSVSDGGKSVRMHGYVRDPEGIGSSMMPMVNDNLTWHLQRMGELSCVDISETYLAHMKIDFPQIPFRRLDVADDGFRELAGEGFDTVTCINVLEHVNADRRALANRFAVLKPGGRLLLFVPALAHTPERIGIQYGIPVSQ